MSKNHPHAGGQANPNPVVKRTAVKAECVFASPALIGSGYGENTDSDILRGTGSRPFLPGSAVAGVLRALCLSNGELSLVESQFGARDNISPLWVFDSELPDAKVIELDGVAIDRENKVAVEQKKYDYEAIATGAKFTIRLLLTIRKNDPEGWTNLLDKLIGALKSGAVSFGAKTRRGFGRVECISAVKREFDLSPGNTSSLHKWIKFDWNKTEGWTGIESETFSSNYATLTVRLKLDGSIMIRDTRNTYEEPVKPDLPDTDAKVPDYKHISVNGKPVILGTSWAGAFRSGLFKLLKQKYPSAVETYLNEVFGFVTESDKSASVSLVYFGASVLEAADTKIDGYRSITRVKIDRFTGGAADGALFNEKPWYGGETTLEIRCPAHRADITELLLLAFESVDKGILQIGGESSIGRGFLKVTAINGEKPDKVFGKPKQNLAAAIEKAGERE
jgi:CRISPR/Cas system CSM-associated protein Csm3 (group 7 of RAMP superfamily)